MTEEIKEIELDHFNNINELKQTVKTWIKEDDMYWNRWFSLYDLKTLLNYITNLQQKDFESQREIMKLKDKLEQQRKENQDTYKDVRIEIKEKNERITNLQQENEFLKFENGNLKTNEQINVEVHNKQLEIITDYKSRLEKASNKLDSMFANGEENKILDDLLELDKIVKGDKQ